jgi:hypothetical protein
MMVDVCIAVRIYPGISKQPFIETTSKHEIVTACIGSLLQSLGNCSYYMFIILDSCDTSYHQLIKSLPLAPGCFEIVDIVGAGNVGTFELQKKLLLEQRFSKNIYFAEDDYFYLPNTFPRMLELLAEKRADFVSPHDHAHYYCSSLHRSFQYKIETLPNGHRFKKVATGCLTFLTTQDTLAECWPVFNTYKKNNYDFSIWLALTRFNIFKLNSWWQNSANIFYYKSVVKLLRFTGGKYIFGKTFTLAVPLPSVGAHMQKDELPPNVDWYLAYKVFLSEFRQSV